MKLRPFLKWVGGKYRLLDALLPALPQGRRLVEPFVGAGAVYLNANYEEYLLCDCNAELISLFSRIQEGGVAFIDYCAQFFTGKTNTEDSFYYLRQRFNSMPAGDEKCALFLYLNRHAYNGLVRYNRQGAYNAPYGHYAAVYFPRKELLAFHQKSIRTCTEFKTQDFTETFAALHEGDVVYADPPYVPLTPTANFTAYAASRFGQVRQRELAALAVTAWEDGVSVVLSNHDTPFARSLHSRANLCPLRVRRSISCRGQTRSAAPEVLIIYHAH